MLSTRSSRLDVFLVASSPARQPEQLGAGMDSWPVQDPFVDLSLIANLVPKLEGFAFQSWTCLEVLDLVAQREPK
jgi:hypothetical protein